MKTTHGILMLAAALAFVWCVPAPALAAKGPLATVQDPVNEVIRILEDSQYKDGANQAEQRQKLRDEIEGVFDFTEMSKRTLARYWRDFSLEQRKEFRDLFAEFLGNIYLSKIQGNFSGEKVVFEGEELLTDDKAVVSSYIERDGTKVPIDYSMIDREKNGSWRVYDVTVENVSLVQNYRSQFSRILRTDKPADLIDRLRGKVEDQKKGEAAEDIGQ